uniref:Uncharacterized protein n=1 Tax=Aegilops tauschii subsp. strangulata TaxID=200361 RepID=A0A452YC29_AEGTS
MIVVGLGLQVTKRVDTEEGQWNGWNWRTEGDMMVNGAFFVPSGEGMENIYDKASSGVDPKSSALVDQLTMGAGVLGGPRDNGEASSYVGFNYAGSATGGGGGGGNGYGSLGMVYANSGDRGCRTQLILSFTTLIIALICCVRLD